MIYCVEDDPSIRDLLAYALHKEGYEPGFLKMAAP